MANLKLKIGGAVLAASMGLIAFFEGNFLKTYRDPVGIPTDCVGHTGPDVRMGYTNTPAECKAKFEKDLQIAYDVVTACYPTYKMSTNETAAIVSLAFNMGAGKQGVKDGVCYLKRGDHPTMRKLFWADQPERACHEIPKWANPPLKGIIKRRAAEEKLCLTK